MCTVRAGVPSLPAPGHVRLKGGGMHLAAAQSGGAGLHGAAAAVECCREGLPPMRVQLTSE